MFHYLFTHDTRCSELVKYLENAAAKIATNTIPSASVAKSENNNILTLQFYFNIYEGSNCLRLICLGDSKKVIVNFVKKFQFPNPRTTKSLSDALEDKIRVAPLRVTLQLLYALKQIDSNEAYLKESEILDFIFYNEAVAKSECPKIFEIASDLIKFRREKILPSTIEKDEGKRIWQHEPRQIREMINIFALTGFVRRNERGDLVIADDVLSDTDKADIYDILNEDAIWLPLEGAEPEEISTSYCNYMDCKIDNKENESLLSIALHIFAKQRDKIPCEWWNNYDDHVKQTRALYSSIDEKIIVSQSFDYENFVHFIFSSRARQTFSRFDNSQKKLIGKFLREERSCPHAISWYINPENKIPIEGIGPGIMLNFMMKIRPEEFASYSGMVDFSMHFLGLLQEDSFGDLNVENYETCKALQQKILQKMHAFGIGKAADDPSAADYLTVNEFLWFVKENYKNILFEEIKMKLTEPKPKNKKQGTKKFKNIVSNNDGDMINRLLAALLTKPFVILTGASGTGKSRMVRKLAYMTCINTQLQPNEETKKRIENFCMVQVKPNWHDSTELLGYRSALTNQYISTDFVRFILKAHAFPETPFFVCLDEMNLAPVEHYFAEFLSASESARMEGDEYITDPIINPDVFEKNVYNLDPDVYLIPQQRKELIENIGLFIPHNLFVVGTVNMDDTTASFSRKVLDRAMTLEMDNVNFDELKEPSTLKLFDNEEEGIKGLLLDENSVKHFIDRCEFTPLIFDDNLKNKLNSLKEKLHQTPLEIAFRFARETTQYREALIILFENSKSKDECTDLALDHMILMKVLPRLEGNREERVGLLNKLREFLNGELSGQKLSLDALDRMEKAAEMNGGYLSFYP